MSLFNRSGRILYRRLFAGTRILYGESKVRHSISGTRGIVALTQSSESGPRSHLGSRHGRVLQAICLGTAACATLTPWHSSSRALHADAALEQTTPQGIPANSVIPKNKMRITLYQYDVCPFCNKVRAYLDYHGIPYTVVEVDPLWKSELSKFPAEYRKVPIALVNDQQVNGSSNIITEVNKMVFGQGMQESSADQEWLEWVDNHLIHTIAPNIYRTPTESLQTFEYIANHAKFPAWQRFSVQYTGATAMYFVAKRVQKKYNIEEPRAAIYDAVNTWTNAVEKQGGVFLEGNDHPGTADLAVYGVLRAIMNFDTFEDIKAHCAAFEPWFERTRIAVGDSAIVERR